MAIVELRSGHVFERGSVKSVTPVEFTSKYNFCFEIVGVGFRQCIYVDIPEKLVKMITIEEKPGMSAADRRRLLQEAEAQQDQQRHLWAKQYREEVIEQLLGDNWSRSDNSAR